MEDAFNSQSCSEEALQRLWEDYWASDRQRLDLRNALCEYYLGTLRKHVLRLRKRYHQVEYSELFNQAALGLMRAVERFTPDKGARFETYMSQMVVFAIKESSRVNDHLKRNYRDRATAYEVTLQRFLAVNGHAPSYEDMAREMELSVEEVRVYAKAHRCMMHRSLEQPIGSPERGREMCEKDLLADASEEVDECVAREEILRRAMSVLSNEERLAIDLCYLRHMTMREAGKVIGISESRVSQLSKSAMERMRRCLQVDAS